MIPDLTFLIALSTRSLAVKHCKLSPQTFNSIKHTCEAIPYPVNHLNSQCGFPTYLLISYKQIPQNTTSLYRMVSGLNYPISISQIRNRNRVKIQIVIVIVIVII